MAASETELIERFFRDIGAQRTDVALGIGDDAALLRAPAHCELVLTTDALVEGVHFLAGASAHSLGYRALAVNLSDVAAMGASPAWALLSLNLPAIDEPWLTEFARGLGGLARMHGVALVGGNLSRGPLSITLQLAGLAPIGTALRRNTAVAGELLYVSGTLGDAAAAHALRSGALRATPADAAFLRARFEYPTPRTELGQALRDLASACIDISDGLYADLSRVLGVSGCGAVIDVQRLPASVALRNTCGATAWQTALSGGEDYELCFSVPPQRATAVDELAATLRQPLTCIGVLRREPGIELRTANAVTQFSHPGYDHFHC